MGRQLSQKDKIKIWEQLVERDGGNRCWYCKKPFNGKRPIIEHLNDNRNDNRLDNLVLSCQSCNIKKISDDTMKRLSDEKLELNEKGIYVREKDLKKLSKSEERTSNEIDINMKNFDITEKYIRDRIDSWDSVDFKDTVDSCVYLCRKNTGHGSHQCVRNYIGSLTCSVGPYQMVKEGKQKLIVKR